MFALSFLQFFLIYLFKGFQGFSVNLNNILPGITQFFRNPFTWYFLLTFQIAFI